MIKILPGQETSKFLRDAAADKKEEKKQLKMVDRKPRHVKLLDS
jgi:hypothetical protein